MIWLSFVILLYVQLFFLLTNGVTLALLMHVSYNAFCKIMYLVTDKCLYVRNTYSLILFKILSFIFVALYILFWNEYIHGALMNAEKTCCIFRYNFRSKAVHMHARKLDDFFPLIIRYLYDIWSPNKIKVSVLFELWIFIYFVIMKWQLRLLILRTAREML